MVIITFKWILKIQRRKLSNERNNCAVSPVAYLWSTHCNPVTNKNNLVVRGSDIDLLFNKLYLILTWVRWLIEVYLRVIYPMMLAGGNSDLARDRERDTYSSRASIWHLFWEWYSSLMWENLPLEQATYILNGRATMSYYALCLFENSLHIVYMCELPCNQVQGIASVLHGVCDHVYMRVTCTVQLQVKVFSLNKRSVSKLQTPFIAWTSQGKLSHG